MRSADESFEKAREYAFLLLKFRLRSEKELYQRLKNKKFTDSIIKKVIVFLKDKQFIHDPTFVKAWVGSSIKKKLGLRRIEEELRLKGIDKGLIDNAVLGIKKDYSQSQVLRDIAQDKLSRLKGVEPYQAKKKVYAYLLRRGFASEEIVDALDQILGIRE